MKKNIVDEPHLKTYSRRKFIGGAAAVTAALSVNPLRVMSKNSQPVQEEGVDFKLKYAPSLGMFSQHAGKNPIDNLKFMRAQGFRAMFDNGLMDKSVQEQETLAGEMNRLGMDWGPFVAYADFSKKSFVTRDTEVRQMLSQRMKEAVEVAKRTRSKWALVVPGRYDESLEWDYQTANVVDNLRFLAEICEPSGLVMVLEPLNPWNHPGLFLTKIPQAYQICKAVNSPNCKIINDIYHQQISEGNLIPNIDRSWDETASFHIGDNPGRKEPTTGEINYKNIFKHIFQKGYEGVLCMEHGKKMSGIEGEKAVIAAYRACDDF
ncbi:MAG: TIM barrel protein [Candidatus Aminicenantes bacterium]|nr:TIM barrel protein [Candidatus Aminicenantes bacterium]